MVLVYKPNDSYQNYYNNVYFIYESQDIEEVGKPNCNFLLIVKKNLTCP